MRSMGLQIVIWGTMMLPLWVLADSAIGKGHQMTLNSQCTYNEIQGTATIVSISKADLKAYNCKDGVEVIFSFKPDAPQAAKDYLFPKSSDQRQRLTVGAGMNPPKQWTEKKGLTVGSTHRCIRKEIIQGACAPVLFVFPEIDLSDWQEACF